jgi:hypothetical protein
MDEYIVLEHNMNDLFGLSKLQKQINEVASQGYHVLFFSVVNCGLVTTAYVLLESKSGKQVHDATRSQ